LLDQTGPRNWLVVVLFKKLAQAIFLTRRKIGMPFRRAIAVGRPEIEITPPTVRLERVESATGTFHGYNPSCSGVSSRLETPD
jgi:hypothetical protein